MKWNTAVHVQQNEASPRKRAFTVDELQVLFDHQAGHSWASTTAAYTTVGQDARNRMLRSALARAFEGEDGR